MAAIRPRLKVFKTSGCGVNQHQIEHLRNHYCPEISWHSYRLIYIANFHLVIYTHLNFVRAAGCTLHTFIHSWKVRSGWHRSCLKSFTCHLGRIAFLDLRFVSRLMDSALSGLQQPIPTICGRGSNDMAFSSGQLAHVIA